MKMKLVPSKGIFREYAYVAEEGETQPTQTIRTIGAPSDLMQLALTSPSFLRMLALPLKEESWDGAFNEKDGTVRVECPFGHFYYTRIQEGRGSVVSALIRNETLFATIKEN